ncbi:MAG TPA: response regulator [Ohtaekwangia sp.]|nr:response regulator [Ohtaekwangia sp.]
MANQRILIIENDEDTLFLLGHALRKSGYTVETCTAGSGLVEFKHKLPDLFILDKDLPTIDGLAITKFLRLQEATRSTPIIMISAHQIRQKAKRTGINELVIKPFQVNHLLKIIKKYTHTASEEIEA